MIWYDDLYFGDSVAHGRRVLIYKINHRKLHPMVYLLVVNPDSESVLEIIPSSCFLQKNYPADHLKIAGICGTRREAKEKCTELIGQVYREQGDLDVAGYLDRRQREKEKKP